MMSSNYLVRSRVRIQKVFLPESLHSDICFILHTQISLQEGAAKNEKWWARKLCSECDAMGITEDPIVSHL